MRDMKSLPDRDPARVKLASAIALASGAARDLRVADDAASLAAQKCWAAQARLDELNKAPRSPIGARAGAFIASVDAGAPCGTEVLERSSIDARAKIAAAENEFAVWDEMRQECDLAAREKEAAVAPAKERVEKAACYVIATNELAERLIAGLEKMQVAIIEQRAVLRFIWGKGINGALSATCRDRIERLLWQDLTGMESTPASAAWVAAFNELMTNSDAELPI